MDKAVLTEDQPWPVEKQSIAGHSENPFFDSTLKTIAIKGKLRSATLHFVFPSFFMFYNLLSVEVQFTTSI